MNYLKCKLLYVDDVNILTDSQFHLFENFLPKDRKIKLKLAYNNTLKKMQVLEYFIVKYNIHLKGITGFQYSKNGKPYVKNKDNFSISHSNNSLVVAISNKNIGVDLQEIIPFDKQLAHYILSEEEYKYLDSANNKDVELTKLWTMKESLIKLLGDNLFLNIKDILKYSNKYIFETRQINNSILTICYNK